MPITTDPLLESAQSEAQAEILTVTGACLDTKKSQTERNIVVNAMNARRRWSVNGHEIEVDEVPWPQTLDPICEHHQIGHWSRAFPGIFHNGEGDPTDDSQRIAKVLFATATTHVALQACSREHTGMTDGDRTYRFEHQLLAATDNSWCYAAKDQLDRKNITNARKTFLANRPDVNELRLLSGADLLRRMKEDPTILKSMTRSSVAIRASKAAYSRDLLMLKNWLAHMQFHHKRRDVPTIFHTITFPGYNDYDLYRLLLVCDGTWEDYKDLDMQAKLKMRVDAFHKHPMLQVKYFEIWREQITAMVNSVYGDLHESAGIEFQRSGNGHAHLLRFVKGAPNMRGVTEEAFCEDRISIDTLNEWYSSDSAIAAHTRDYVERTYEHKDKHESLTEWAKKELRVDEEDSTCRFLFLIMSIERTLKHASHVGGLDIDYLAPRQQISAGMTIEEVSKSNEEFLATMSIFEDDEILIEAQHKAAAQGKTASSVRLAYLQGEPIHHLQLTSQRSSKYRGLDVEKAISSRVIAEIKQCCLKDKKAAPDTTGIERWNEEYLYCMIFEDAMTDAWSPLLDAEGELIEGLQSWDAFVQNELDDGSMEEGDRWKWTMSQEPKDGILLSTSEMRERFVGKYGFEHFYGLVQQHAQFHSCSDDYCRAPKRRTTKHADGKVNTPTNKQKKASNNNLQPGHTFSVQRLQIPVQTRDGKGTQPEATPTSTTKICRGIRASSKPPIPQHMQPHSDNDDMPQQRLPTRMQRHGSCTVPSSLHMQASKTKPNHARISDSKRRPLHRERQRRHSPH